MKHYLGVDLGSISTDAVLLDDNGRLVRKLYMRTGSSPLNAVLSGYKTITDNGALPVYATGTTGSGRELAGALLNAEVIKNEITAHGVAALELCPEVRTVIEIGGQDSKLILLKDGIVCDFCMNTVCAAGTGSFLDRQAQRLGIPVEEIGALALSSHNPVRIAGKCAVFAETDMIHRQQEGCSAQDILAGLCSALVRGYLNNLATGKRLLEPILFQGGVAANSGIKAAFERELGVSVKVPENYEVMGAYGAALLAREYEQKNPVHKPKKPPQSDGWSLSTKQCKGCANSCSIVTVMCGRARAASFGGRCDRGSTVREAQQQA